MASVDRTGMHRGWIRPAVLSAAPVATAVAWAVSALVSPSAMDAFFLLWPISSTLSAMVGALILWKRPGHHMGRLLVAVGMMVAASAVLGAVTTTVDPFATRFPRLTFLLRFASEGLSNAALLVGSVSVIVRFPTGRRTSRLGLLVEVLIVTVLSGQAVAAVTPELDESIRSVFALPAFATYPLAAIDIALRYRHAAPVERTQFRWLIAAAAATGVLLIPMLLFGDRIEELWSVWIASTFLPTLAVGVAVLRYRLYDIDRIISRSLTYGAVSLFLFGTFFLTNILLQRAISSVVEANVIATAGSTLLVASLFQPVRRRVQQVVDQRFHRARYDADRTVDAFAGRLRHGVDLRRLVGDLRQTAGDAVEPSAASVWLRGART